MERLAELYRQKDFGQTLQRARALVEEYPDSSALWNIIGSAERSLTHLDAAEQAFRHAVKLDPKFALALFNLGLVLNDRGNQRGAVEAYRQALEVDRDFAQAHNNLGIALQRQGALQEAIACGERARTLRPDLAEVHNSLGNAFRAAGRLSEAGQAYRDALLARPDYASAHYNLAVTLNEQGHPGEALKTLLDALRIKPDFAPALAQLVHQLATFCDWRSNDELTSAIANLGVETDAVSPFNMLAREDAPQRQLARAKKWAGQLFFDQAPAIPKTRTRARHPNHFGRVRQKLRIGYFSADFHNHPMMFLMSGLFRHHDRNEWEVHAFSYGRNHHDEGRAAAETSVDHFHDVAGFPEDDIVKLARSLDLHIAIDRKGYTTNSRSEIFRHRLAPIHVNYLAYPSTMGSDCIDYIVADPIVISDNQRANYSENLITMPHSYAPADNEREISKTVTTRADFGLPLKGFVFCCFNAAHKITSREFDIWMRVMAKVDGSVLWLLRPCEVAVNNLRKEAAQRGIDPARLVFADRLPVAKHLARHKHADLFLDTFNYNAHTTASDALWAGLPVVTKQGEQFAARVCASLLGAVGLPELVTASPDTYERLILNLARRPDALDAINRKLSVGRSTMPLFDTARYTRNFETGLRAAFDLHLAGKPCADIAVTDTLAAKHL